jgi:hypothetical protein
VAHFAQLDEDNVVIKVVVIGNEDICDEDGNEVESIGVAFCQSLFGEGNWVQTSYNGTFRKRYAGVGYTYDADYDAFIPPKPFASWVFDEVKLNWAPPVPFPSDGGRYDWDEASGSWEAIAGSNG